MDWLPLAGLAKGFKDLPTRLQTTFIQLMTMSAADFLDQWFETEPLKATMSASGIIGTFQGPRSPGTAYVLLHHYMGEIDGAFRAWGIPKGGTGGVSNAIANAALSLGVEIRTEAPVARIDVHGGRTTGVTLESGEVVQAGAVLSSVDSNLTFLKLLEPGTLDPDFEAEVRRYKYRGSSGKVNLALDGLPELACKPGVGPWLRGAISFSPNLDYMERAYDDAKFGRFSRRPYIDCIMPTLVDPSMAPPGKHIMSCFVQYAPYKLEPGKEWDDAEREAFGENVIDTLEERFPGHPQQDPAQDVHHAEGHRGRHGPHRGQHLPGRALAGAVVLQPAGARDGRATAPRCRTCGCAARRRTRAAASWVRPAASPRSST